PPPSGLSSRRWFSLSWSSFPSAAKVFARALAPSSISAATRLNAGRDQPAHRAGPPEAGVGQRDHTTRGGSGCEASAGSGKSNPTGEDGAYRSVLGKVLSVPDGECPSVFVTAPPERAIVPYPR